MNIHAMYQNKLTTPEQAVTTIRSGSWIDYGFCTGHPVLLDKALAEHIQKSNLRDINFRGAIALWQPEVTKLPDAADRITWNTWHASGIERRLIGEGNAYYIPMRFSEVPRYYRENIGHVDAMLIQVAPMDKNGWFNFGPSATYQSAVCQCADQIIVEVNPNMPVCPGGMDAGIHISQVSAIVENSGIPIGQLPSSAPNSVDEAVAQLILPQIPNGACLQLGIGGMPNAVGEMIAKSDLKELGIHTEMYVDAFVDLAEAGKLTGRKKNIDRGLQTFALAIGTQRLYDYLHENPSVLSAPVDYVNDVRVISSIDNFISINNAVSVDLFGQVASETAGTRHISGAGGQLDFVLGAYLSKGGKSFICCSSTIKEKNGTLKSRLCPTLDNGSIVTDTRANIQYLVTEYGMVNLKGLSTWQRAEAVISVAHPDFREDLISNAEKLGIWRRSNRR